MTDAERIVELEERLSEERAYSAAIEVKIDMEVEKRVAARLKDAEETAVQKYIDQQELMQAIAKKEAEFAMAQIQKERDLYAKNMHFQAQLSAIGSPVGPHDRR
jgi:TPP-dependent pyruvate/acetoin dehydrogenase alpha subunit